MLIVAVFFVWTVFWKFGQYFIPFGQYLLRLGQYFIYSGQYRQLNGKKPPIQATFYTVLQLRELRVSDFHQLFAEVGAFK